MIPDSIEIFGDVHEGKQLIGMAKSQLRILQKLMSHQKLNEGVRTINPFPGVTIEAWSSFSRHGVRIFVASEDVGGKSGEETIESKKCPCFPHFSMGEILAVYPEEYDNKWLIDGQFYYDIEVCSKLYYLRFNTSYDMNFGRYYKGQYVLVTIAYDALDAMLKDNRNCLLDYPRFDIIGVSLIHINGGMGKWEGYTSETTYYAN